MFAGADTRVEFSIDAEGAAFLDAKSEFLPRVFPNLSLKFKDASLFGSGALRPEMGVEVAFLPELFDEKLEFKAEGVLLPDVSDTLTDRRP